MPLWALSCWWGLVKKNGIIMIDFALEAERKEGKGPVEAIHEGLHRTVPAHL